MLRRYDCSDIIMKKRPTKNIKNYEILEKNSKQFLLFINFCIIKNFFPLNHLLITFSFIFTKLVDSLHNNNKRKMFET